jgi:hypothetical protein
MGKQIGQSAKVTPLLPVNPTTENIELAVPVARQFDEARQVFAPSHVCACIGYLAPASANRLTD